MVRALRRIAAIATLAFREAVRSRLAASTALAVGAAILVIRRTTSGADVAAAHNFVFYALAAVETILFTSALAASAAAVSGEARAKTLQLVRAKPVPMIQFLAGRWLGLCGTFAALLAAALAAIRLCTPGGGDATCFDRVAPALPPVAAEADEIVAEAREKGVTDARELRAIRRDALLRLPFATTAISPGEALNVAFPLAHPLDGTRPIRLEIAFSSDAYSSTPLSAICELRPARSQDAVEAEASRSDIKVEISVTNITSRLLSLPVDAAPFAGADALALFLRHGGAEGEMPVMLQPRRALAILVPACGATANFARAFLVLLPVVALLLALGLALGALFSLPVALFAAAGLVLSVFAAGYAADDPDALEPDGDASQHLVHRATRAASVAVVGTLGLVARTATDPSPAALLSDNIAIPSREAASSVGWNGLVIPLALLLVAATILERRELP